MHIRKGIILLYQVIPNNTAKQQTTLMCFQFLICFVFEIRPHSVAQVPWNSQSFCHLLACWVITLSSYWWKGDSLFDTCIKQTTDENLRTLVLCHTQNTPFWFIWNSSLLGECNPKWSISAWWTKRTAFAAWYEVGVKWTPASTQGSLELKEKKAGHGALL